MNRCTKTRQDFVQICCKTIHDTTSLLNSCCSYWKFVNEESFPLLFLKKKTSSADLLDEGHREGVPRDDAVVHQLHEGRQRKGKQVAKTTRHHAHTCTQKEKERETFDGETLSERVDGGEDEL